jgi:hypothetical protein
MAHTKISNTKRIVELLWFNQMRTNFYENGDYLLVGKGYGCFRDIETGEDLFLYGQEIGGGMYGEDADEIFMEKGCLYVVDSAWVRENDNDNFFMGMPLRIKKIATLDGHLPNNKQFEFMKSKIKKIA